MSNTNTDSNTDATNTNKKKNWSKQCEDVLNLQIYTEYWASLQYHIIFAYFDRHTVGLRNIAEYFNKASLEEREHAHKFMHYQNQRGGRVSYATTYDIDFDLKIQETESKSDVLYAFEKALEMEQHVYECVRKRRASTTPHYFILSRVPRNDTYTCSNRHHKKKCATSHKYIHVLQSGP
jgi:hypothetical protein